MAFLEKHRIRFYEHFVEHVGEEAAEAMLAQFPSRDADEIATKADLAVAMAGVEAQFAGVTGEFAGVSGEFARVRAEIAELRTEVVKQTERLMARLQIVAALGFAFLGAVITLSR